MSKKRKGDLVEKWLKENDPYYGDRSIEYSYLTKRRLKKKVYKKEIPASCLTQEDKDKLLNQPFGDSDETLRRLFGR